jgi:hypothetical protein
MLITYGYYGQIFVFCFFFGGCRAGSVVEVVKVERTGAMCGEFAARVKVPIDAWKMSSTSVCLDFEVRALPSVNAALFEPHNSEINPRNSLREFTVRLRFCCVSLRLCVTAIVLISCQCPFI